MAHLLIIDDDPEIVSALVRGLELHGYAAKGETRADHALKHLTEGQFDGAIVDVMLGADSGLDLVKRVRENGIQIPILMLSALSEVEHRTAGLEAGADDYVVKPFSFDELVARLRVQEHRAQAQRPGPATLTLVDGLLKYATQEARLTERECDLLGFLAANADTPQPRDTIFDSLWSADGSSNLNVVDVYIGYLRKKLAGQDFGFEIKTVRNKGFCLTGVPPAISQ